MGNLFSFSLPTTLVLLWACAPERAYNFQKYPRGCFSSDRRLKTVFQLSEQAINSKKHFPDWGTPPSTVQIHKTVRRRNLQTDQDRSRLPRSQMSLQRRGTRLHKAPPSKPPLRITTSSLCQTCPVSLVPLPISHPLLAANLELWIQVTNEGFVETRETPLAPVSLTSATHLYLAVPPHGDLTSTRISQGFHRHHQGLGTRSQ
jgi:hypothetical protein